MEHAKDPAQVLEEKVKKLAELGFDENIVRDALRDCAMDEDAALNLILSRS